MFSRGPGPLSYVCVSVMLLLAAGLVYRDHPLVVLASEHPNDGALLGGAELAPGQATSVTDTLSNHGMLPVGYALQVASPGGSPIPTAYRLQIKRASDGAVLFKGPLPRDSGTLGSLNAGRTVVLELTLSLPKDQPATHLPADLALRWRGQAGVASSWLLPLFEVFLVLAVLAIAGRWILEARASKPSTSGRRPRLSRTAPGAELSGRRGP